MESFSLSLSLSFSLSVCVAHILAVLIGTCFPSFLYNLFQYFGVAQKEIVRTKEVAQKKKIKTRFSFFYVDVCDTMPESTGLSLDDDIVRFISCPSNSSCCSFAATESHVFFGHTSGEMTVCRLEHNSRGLETVATLTTLLPAELNTAEDENPRHSGNMSLAIDCLCVCPYASISGTLISSLHRGQFVTFVTFDAMSSSPECGGLQVGRSLKLFADDTSLQYTNRVTAHCWLDDDTFLVGCLNGTVLAVSASVNDSHRVMLREESPIIQMVWDVETSVLVISSVRRSIVVTYANDSTTFKPIGNRPREEGLFGACICPINHAVYAARHNARVFEYVPSTGEVSRTYRMKSDVALGVLKPLRLSSFLASSSQGDENLDGGKEQFSSPILLWSEGPRFISFLFLSATDTHHITRRFDDVAIVSSVVLSSIVLVLCSDGRLMCIPLGGKPLCLQEDRVENTREILGQPEPEQTRDAAINKKRVHRIKVVKKIVRVVRRRELLEQSVSSELPGGDAPFSDCVDSIDSSSFTADDKAHSCDSPVSLKLPLSLHPNKSFTDEADAEGTTQNDDLGESLSLQEEGGGHADNCASSHLSEATTTLPIVDGDIPLSESSTTARMNFVSKENELQEEKPVRKSKRFFMKLDQIIRLFNVHALHLGEHEQLYTAVREFLPLLEERMMECGLLTKSFHSVLSQVRVVPCGANSPATCDSNREDTGPFIEEEATVNALRNVLKSALTWSIKDKTGDKENPWIQTLFILHLLLALPWPAPLFLAHRHASEQYVGELERWRSRGIEEEWCLEEASVIEKTVKRSGADGRYLPLVLALSTSFVSSMTKTQSGRNTRFGISGLINGHEQCMSLLLQLQCDRRSLIGSECPLPMEFHLEKLIVEESSKIVEAMEASRYPFCFFYVYFPYIFATYPSKAIILAMQHYPGTSLAFFEWALSSSVQGVAFQQLRKMGSELERLSLEDLADGLADLVLALFEASRANICNSPADYLACLRILLQRRFALLWSQIKMGQMKLKQMKGAANARETVQSHHAKKEASTTLRTQRKLQRVEGGVLGLLQLVRNVIITLGVGNSVQKEEFKQNVLSLLEEHDFPEGVVELCWIREYIEYCITKGSVERLFSLFQLPGATSQKEWTLLFHRAHEENKLEIAMLFCLSVEKLPYRVRQLLENAFPKRFESVEAAHGDEQLERVALKLSMLF
ncbi:hypothetical protein MOQ_004886 [Trypanosoma cruzi marinkellei]|uniref:Uncharacterized protein n=1 Tax=Trypanosoma cruzi marinkellei TaxID=85056 RepID=K2N902_TRYCR|nr:hypothetical protein MOQ_004886 [Trypanosoma cruzi marinkellei]